MRAIRSIQKPLARLLLLSVCNLCCVAGLAQEVSLSSMSVAKRNLALPATAPTTAAQAALHPLGAEGRFSAARPRGVTGSIGQVTWKNLNPGMPIWHCRTDELASVALGLGQARKVIILERSSVILRENGNDVVITLLAGSVQLEAAGGGRIHLETYDGVYQPDPAKPFQAKFTWRDGRLVTEGKRIDKLEAEVALLGCALRILPCEEHSVLSVGKSRAFSVSVADAAGQPLPGVPVVFSSGQTGNSRLRVAFSGRMRVTVLTDEQGVATVSAAALGEAGPTTLLVTVPGTGESTTIPADVVQTTGHQKVAALAILAGIAAATVVLAVRAATKEDPKLQPGTPSRVTP